MRPSKIFSVGLVAFALLGLLGQRAELGKSVAANAAVETSLGAVLDKPVFQCGTGTDLTTEDTRAGSVTVFESGSVRPITLSADGKRLLVANAAANCLEIYAVNGDTLKLASSVAVGLEPVAVAERNANEIWVVNHLSDSVSVVRIDGTPRVLRTLQVGDEPRDIVFAGANRDRAFITAAARGQNRPGASSAALTAAGQGRADVWVYDAGNLDDTLNGNPLTILTLFADAPRALAVSADGATVYAASHFSGNRTTTLHRDAVLNSKPEPSANIENVFAPATGLIVKHDGTAWRDETKRDWSSKVNFNLPDYDVFAIDASAATPTLKKQISGVGTTLFNMAVHPTSGKVFVSNTEAQNHIRFEGATPGASSVRGRLAESRISVVDAVAASVNAVHLNPHIDFSLPAAQITSAANKAKSLSQPAAMVFSPNGDTLYVAALGSSKIAALPTASLTSAAFAPNAAHHIRVGNGPTGLAINAAGTRLFVYSRVSHSVSIVDTGAKSVVASVPLFSPESTRVKDGRRILYDADFTSSNGTVSCSSCHVFGDMDHLAWDLGNPGANRIDNPNRYVPSNIKTTFKFHPMKGPMSTQTLRGMAGNGPLHWRGDRTGQNRQTIRGALESLEAASFKEFNPAFVELLGRETPLTDADMQAFTDFAMALKMPPNPVRALDNSLSKSQAAGRDTYLNAANITALGSCNHCHTLNPQSGQFGTAGLMSFEGFRITENFKVPQLRNVYQKIGMFGFSTDSGPSTGAQVRGFGFAHDGSIDTLKNFFSDPVFVFPEPAEVKRAEVVDFMLAMDTDLLPAVGQQITWRPGASAEIEARLTLLKQQAMATPAACDLVVRSTANGVSTSGLMQRDGSWSLRGIASLVPITEANVKAQASASQPITFTCVPPGNGERIALAAVGTVGVTPTLPPGSVFEFYNGPLDNYFITANAAEASAIDSGSAGPGWTRTGDGFKAGGIAGNSVPVCRFYGSQKPGPNSHFYTALASECASLRALEASTPASQPRWNFESFDFSTALPTNGNCAAGTLPVYRAYNNGNVRGVDSNHRITSNRNAIAEVVGRGWKDEGVVMCAPS